MAELTTLPPEAIIPNQPLNMDTFHCDTLELRARFDSGQMDIEAFLEDVSERGLATKPDEDGDILLTVPFRPITSSAEYHAHLSLRLWSDQSGSINLAYHSGELGEKGIEPPPDVDDCAQWLGGFFKDALETHLHANYSFDKSFVSTVGLNYQLATTEKSLIGAVVSGLSLIFPNDPGMTAIIQSGTDETYVFLRQTVQLDLAKLNLFSELDRLSALVNNLIKKTD